MAQRIPPHPERERGGSESERERSEQSKDAPRLSSASIGIGLRAPHLAEIAATRPALGFLEVHAENYMGGGPALTRLERLGRDYRLEPARRGLVAGQRRRHRRGASRAPQASRPAPRAIPRLRASLLERQRRHLSQRPAAAALYRGGARHRRRQCRRARRTRSAARCCWRIPRPICAFATRPSPKPTSSPSWCGAAAAGCSATSTTSSSARAKSRPRCRRLSRRAAGAGGGRDPSRRPCHGDERRRQPADRRPWARVAAPVWALYRRALSAFRRGAEPGRMGPELPALAVLLDEARQAERIASGREAGDVDAVKCRWRSAARCSRMRPRALPALIDEDGLAGASGSASTATISSLRSPRCCATAFRRSAGWWMQRFFAYAAHEFIRRAPAGARGARRVRRRLCRISCGFTAVPRSRLPRRCRAAGMADGARRHRRRNRAARRRGARRYRAR